MNESSINLIGREKDVLKLMIAGYSNPQISEKLLISLSTVKAHVSAIIDKFGVTNRTEVTREAFKRGFIDNDE